VGLYWSQQVFHGVVLVTAAGATASWYRPRRMITAAIRKSARLD
jgi:hypothetical protein